MLEYDHLTESLPSRERGLKFLLLIYVCEPRIVAPLAGAWIEILAYVKDECKKLVAPLAGAWIEILVY